MNRRQICILCHYQGSPIKITKGSFLIELALWLLFVIPGLLYSLWRLSSRHQACPRCRQAGTMIPLDSPRARTLVLGEVS